LKSKPKFSLDLRKQTLGKTLCFGIIVGFSVVNLLRFSPNKKQTLFIEVECNCNGA
jgi:hypothetical protein